MLQRVFGHVTFSNQPCFRRFIIDKSGSWWSAFKSICNKVCDFCCLDHLRRVSLKYLFLTTGVAVACAARGVQRGEEKQTWCQRMGRNVLHGPRTTPPPLPHHPLCYASVFKCLDSPICLPWQPNSQTHIKNGCPHWRVDVYCCPVSTPWYECTRYIESSHHWLSILL